MRDFIQILKRFIPPYKARLAKNILYNILSAVFGSISFVILVPVLNILFGLDKEVWEPVPFALTQESLMHNFNYYITLAKASYSPQTTLLMAGGLFALAALFKAGCAYMAAYEIIYIRNGVVRDIRRLIYKKILSLPLPFFSEERKGDIIARTTGDVQEVENSIMNSLEMFFQNPIIILIYLTAMIFMSWQLTLFVLVLLPIMGTLIGKVGKSLKKTSKQGQDKMGEILSNIEETLSGLRVIKAFNAEGKVEANFSAHNEQYRRIMNRLMRRRSLAHPMSEFLGTIVVVIVVWFGGTLILRDHPILQPAQFISYIALFYSIINPAKQFSTALYSIQKGTAAMDRIDDILNAQTTIPQATHPVPLKQFNREVEYRHVDFAYRPGRLVLQDINITIPKGTTIALVGQSGSGKTTLADLLPRFYDVTRGEILIDGVNIKDTSFHDLRELIGYVNQEPILFNDTIYNNITFGVPNATPEQVEQAARVANAHDFILQTEHGYQTTIGDRGGKLSGGQRQRLSIARAVLKNPPILILDEATSALDTESEKLVQQALDNLMRNRTSIVIAHRLSTIRNADLILVFHEGHLIEQGTHDQLLQLNGTYAKLYNMQIQ